MRDFSLRRALWIPSAVTLVLLSLMTGGIRADCGAIPIDPTSYDDSEYQPTDGESPEYYDDEDSTFADDESFYEDDETLIDEDETYADDDGAWEDWSDASVTKAVVREPTQKAVLAWNGREQLMVLKTELSASRPGKMMEIMPLPGRPSVTKGDEHLFNRTLHLFSTKHGLPPAVLKSPGARVIDEVQIGNHRIAVARVVNPAKFVSWANQFVRQRLGRNAQLALGAQGQKIITHYLNEGYRYWVFDLIDLDTQTRPHVAIQYQFPTRYLYYPLRITATAGRGDTHIQLLVLTDTPLRYFRGVKRNQLQAPQPSVSVSQAELRQLSPVLAGLFAGQSVRLHLWEMRGPIESFQGDLQARAQPVNAEGPASVPPPTARRRKAAAARRSAPVERLVFRNETGVDLVPYERDRVRNATLTPVPERTLAHNSQLEIAMSDPNFIFYDPTSQRGLMLQHSQVPPYQVQVLVYRYQVPPGTEGKDPLMRPTLISRSQFDVATNRPTYLVLNANWSVEPRVRRIPLPLPVRGR